MNNNDILCDIEIFNKTMKNRQIDYYGHINYGYFGLFSDYRALMT